ncbi:peptide deformylase [Curtobacterium sp. MCJR17_055]|uniref:peptide deformylase n=1 Tax=unclassified Curtobacterium TaxID=257496 RepID=UPI000D8E9F38|nr:MULTISPECIES: peptide deformylase [unclassified Curtobacterium]PYY34121.1 peptide deformylase [Curtobacterium sp. MCBD17_029]PYY43215.1 peptide deformylase [Curtobacterium sp. MCPF17_046]PYY50809.1 peptide deformylase [Curtobacterium sp. MCBD17_023]PYY53971.1 peptide deformylase [Curtobacterium sp. MCJR17_055]PYY59142.1 peptide deformylase [Curtobacterium sp. MCPF17_015]
MPVLPIRITGDPVLHTPATEVTVFDDALRALVADMVETMDLAPGVGLAGPQVGVGKRLFVYSWTDDDGVLWRGVAVNPVLWTTPPLPESVEELDEDEESEGCLSIPGERFPLRRSEGALLRAVDEYGEPFEIEAHGWLARVFQHEYDHLDGLLYADRLVHPYAKQAQKAVRKNSWGGPGKSWLPGRDHPEG